VLIVVGGMRWGGACQLKRAYDVLSDVNKRALYDQNLRVRERVKSSRSVNIWPSAPTDTQPRKPYDDNLDIRAQQSRSVFLQCCSAIHLIGCRAC
jgi:curved DNA-binding protein CbpA